MLKPDHPRNIADALSGNYAGVGMGKEDRLAIFNDAVDTLFEKALQETAGPDYCALLLGLLTLIGPAKLSVGTIRGVAARLEDLLDPASNVFLGRSEQDWEELDAIEIVSSQ